MEITKERLWRQFCRDYESVFGVEIPPSVTLENIEENEQNAKFWKLWKLGYGLPFIYFDIGKYGV